MKIPTIASSRRLKEPLIKASSAVSGSFPRLFEPLFPHLSSDRLRKSGSKIHRNCLRFRQASFNQRFLKSLAVVFGMVCLAQQGMAATILNWGGDYVSAYQNIVGTPTTSAGNSTWHYSKTTPKSPSSGYSGPAFYGAFSLTYGNGTGTPAFRADLSGVANSAAADQMRFSSTAAGTGTTVTMRGLVFFDQSSFLGNASTGTVTFDSDSSMKLNITTSIGPTGSRSTRMAVYALVGTEWGWYISGSSRAGAAPLEIAPLTASWGLYSINESSAPLGAAPTTFSTLGSAFKEIGAVGYFFEYTSDTNAAVSLYISSYEFNGNVAIPEPSMAMLWLGGAAMLVSYRKFAGRR